MSAAAEERAVELLVDRVTQGLDPEREAEMETLLRDLPDLDSESFEVAAAAVELAYTRVDEPLPERLRRRVAAQAEELFSTRDVESDRSTVLPFPERAAAREGRAPDTGRRLGWLVAAASLAVAVASWLPERERSDPAAGRAALVERAGDLIEAEWTATEDPAARGASGDVVWSSAEQTGYMRFRGLEANDPSISQYQLWIFDAEQDERFPVDGGVFDVPAGGEVVVPIEPGIRVVQPTLFAITVEKPGGVVVSSRERLPLLARVG